MTVNPKDAPLSLNVRSKLTMEIFTLAEIQRMASETCWILQECTSWDCPILPTLGFRPDYLWVFDCVGNLFSTCGGCKLDMSTIGYVLQLEIIEVSRKIHSNRRTPNDEIREAEIRTLFSFHSIPIGIVYLTVAHTGQSAHPDDIFFSQQTHTNEWEVPDEKLVMWQERLNEVFDCMLAMVRKKDNRTYYFGH